MLTKIIYGDFVSEEPATQCGNKTYGLHSLVSRLHLEVPNVEEFSWIFSESVHGKGAPHGVGAVVAARGDIYRSFVDTIKQKCTGIIMFTIYDEAILKMNGKIQKETVNLC